MRIVVTGASGMFGGDIVEVLSSAHEVIPFKGRADVDLSKPLDTMRAVKAARPDAIVHAAAWRDVDACELDADAAFINNVLSTRHVMLAAADLGCKVVHISSDAVFDGEKQAPYHEFDAPNPINVYGRTKLAAENEVRCFVRRHFIVRVPLLFGVRGPASANLILKTVETARAGREVVATSDQITNPTYTRHAAQVIEGLLCSDMYGTYHVANAGTGSRWDVAAEILRSAGLGGAKTRPAASAEMRRPARRQRYSVLKSLCLKGIMDSEPPDWREALRECIDHLRSLNPDLSS